MSYVDEHTHVQAHMHRLTCINLFTVIFVWEKISLFLANKEKYLQIEHRWKKKHKIKNTLVYCQSVRNSLWENCQTIKGRQGRAKHCGKWNVTPITVADNWGWTALTSKAEKKLFEKGA